MPDTAAPILLISPAGMLGRAWKALLEAQDLPHEAVGRPELDLTRPDTIDARVTGRYRTVINCAAWTDVDGAETQEAAATAVNGDGVAALARRCRETGATLVHYSTDYVFNGEGSAPYPVDHPRDPVNAYGRSKAAGEEAIEASGCTYLLLRTSWLYAPWGKNFVLTMARLTHEKDALKVVDDQRGRPTSCTHLAATSLALLKTGARGTFHATDGGECTWYEFTRAINDLLDHGCDVRPCTTEDFPRPAKRPAYSVLDLSKTEARVGVMADWRRNLAGVLDRIAGSTGSTG